MSSIIDLTGERFGKLTVVCRSPSPKKRVYWLCRCDCGGQKIMSAYRLREKNGTGLHCGCVKKNQHLLIDMIGKRFGRLLVLRRGPDYQRPSQTHARYYCLCDCGKETLTVGFQLRAGDVQSCGCYAKEMTSKRSKTHGLSKHPEAIMWKCAHDRSKKDGLEFNISVLDIKIPERCPLLNIPIVQNKGKYGPCANSPSLDRIDSSRGYTQDNIWVISHKANTIKSNATVSEIRLIADNLEGKINEISRHTFENQPRIGTI